MLRIFLMTLLSSWIVNPLGVAVAHHFNVANTPTVVLLLLGLGSCIPFQLFMNECLAAGKIRKQFDVSTGQLTLVIAMQTGAYVLSVTRFSRMTFSAIEIVVLGGFLIIYTLLSYQAVLVFYKLVTRGHVSSQQAALVGALPGLTSLAIYTGYCAAITWWTDIPRITLLLACPMPAILVWRLIISIEQKTSNNQISPAVEPIRLADTFNISSIAILLTILSIISSNLRENIALGEEGYAALILVGLNAFVSISNTITRSRFLAQGTLQISKLLILGSIIMIVLGMASMHFSRLISLFYFLIATQFLTVMLIERGRKMKPATLH
jgi:hypothetical protein